MRNYRDNWFNVGAVLAMVIAGALALSHRRLSRSRLFSALNLAALMVHQFEEYGFPGYFPGMLNAGVFKSDKPERYPLNTNSALIVNAVVGYPFYLLPVLFPKRRSLGLAPVLFGFGLAVFHGIVPPLRAKARYGPGFLAAFFLHVPIGINYIRAVGSERPSGRGEWARAADRTIARRGARGVIQTPAGWRLEELRSGLHKDEEARYWQANLLFERVSAQVGHPV